MSAQLPATDAARGFRADAWKTRAAVCTIDISTSVAGAYLAFLLCSGLHVRANVGSIFLIAAIFALTALLSRSYRDNFAVLEASDMVRAFGAVVVASAAAYLLFIAEPRLAGAEPSQVIISAFIILTLWIGARLLAVYAAGNHGLAAAGSGERTLIVGAGQAARTLIDVVRAAPSLPFHIVGCVDDDIQAHRVNGVPFRGKIEGLTRLIAELRVENVVVAIPSASVSFVNKVVSLCAHATAPGGKAPSVKVLPGASDLLTGNVTISRIRDIRLEDLLQRDPVKIDLSAVMPHLQNQVVLVTGAGGSIGSELCRQIAAFEPRQLLLLGHGENSLFKIEQELRFKHNFTRTQIVLADVADANHIRTIFSQYRPHVVFHAAAHKHVPIVEQNVCEAVRNNILGTHMVALAAAAAGVGKFILLSTDKAVNPTSVMGATKRMSELIVQSFAHCTSTEFVCVRFGNVLGSRGSVLPIFKQQLESGGPITVTHREMQRYFMTIPEAVSLVLQAMSMGRDGQVFVLDMGAPVKIIQLAEMVVTLSGLTPYRDIDIVETGIRPGEKLFEEILTSSEGISKTTHERLFIAQQERMDYDILAAIMRKMQRAIALSDWRSLIALLNELIPSFTPGTHLLQPAALPAPLAAADGGGDAPAPVPARGTNGHATNGHAGNGHAGNGHAGNGHAGNGHAGNGQPANGARRPVKVEIQRGQTALRDFPSSPASNKG